MITVFSITSSSGTGRYTAHLAGELAKYQPVTLIAPAFNDYLDLLNNVELRKIVNISNIKSRILRIFLLLCSTITPIRYFISLRLKSRLLYFANAGHWPQIGVYLLAAKLCRYKTALLIHDVLPHRRLFPPALAGLEPFCLRMIYGLADKLVVHHVGAIADLSALGLRHLDKIVVIPHGMFSLPAPAMALQTDADESLKLLLFGQIRQNKNILPSILAVQTLRAEGHAISLRICGRASARESDYLANCRQAIARQPDGISLEEGFIAERDLPPLVDWCDAFLLPYSEFHSQSGVAMLALANAKAVIASAAGGLADLIQDGRNGIQIDDTDGIGPSAIVAAIRRAQEIGKPGLAAFGLLGRSALEESTAWPVVGRQHDAMLQSLLQKGLS